MEEMLFNVILLNALLFPPLLLGIWFFGLRRYIAEKGKARITAANWGLSMWADWTVAWEIGREEGKVPLSVKTFLILHIVVIVEIAIAFIP